jgi:fucose 4-O-acetylase-like acetyltransferase
VKERLISMDVLKLFAIFCVIVGHGVQYLHGQDYVFQDDTLFGFIYSFHIPLFMVVSGYFALGSMRKPFPTFFKAKFLQLIYPTVVFGFIALALQKVLGVEPFGVRWALLGSFWFLRSLFACYLVAYVLRRWIRPVWLFILVSMVLTRITDDALHVAFTYPFFLLGMGISVYRDAILKHIKVLFAASAVAFFTCLMWWNGQYAVYFTAPPTLMGWWNDGSTLGEGIKIGAYRFLTGASGSVMFLLLFTLMFHECRGKLAMLTAEMGRHTLRIYVLQLLLIEIVCKAYPFLSVADGLMYDVYCIGIGALILLLLYALSLALGRLPKVDGLLFGKPHAFIRP